MKKQLLLLCALLAVATSVRADTSYLLIQGPFGAGNAVETYKWKVLYTPGSLTTSFDLLSAVLGAPSNTGTTYNDAFAGSYDLYRGGNATTGVAYIQSFGAFFATAFTLSGREVAMDSDYNPGWNYYVAGSSYPNGSWTYSNDGIEARALSNGSYDGWVFGSTGEYDPFTYEQLAPPVAIAGATAENSPGAASFADAAVINVVPEPGSAALLLLGLAGLALRRRSA